MGGTYGALGLPGVKVGRPWLDVVWEAEGKVAEGDDGVCSDGGMRRLLEDSEQKLEMSVAELGAVHGRQRVK